MCSAKLRPDLSTIRLSIAMKPTMKTKSERLSEQIEQLRQEAEEAKAAKNFELSFVLLDQAEALEKQLEQEQ